MKTLTVDDIMSMRPCVPYNRERVSQLFAGRESLTLVEALEVDITHRDRMWLITRYGVISGEVTRAWINKMVDRLIRARCLTSDGPKMRQWAEKWLSGENRTFNPQCFYEKGSQDNSIGSYNAVMSAINIMDNYGTGAAHVTSIAFEMGIHAKDTAVEEWLQIETLIELLKEQG